MLKYLFAKKPQDRWLDVPPGAAVFTYHQENALRALLSGLLVVAFVEAAALHLLLAMWNHWVALAATLSTAWAALQIIAQIRAVGLRPIYVHQGKLMLRNGAFDIAEIGLDQIKHVEATSKDIVTADGDPKPLNVSFPASPNVVLRLHAEAEATILNRSRRPFQIALLAMDDPTSFVEYVHGQLFPAPGVD